MTGHRKFGERRQQLRTSPEYRELERRRRAVQALEVVDAVQALTAVREARGVTQVEVAHAWGTTQSNVSRFEQVPSMYRCRSPRSADFRHILREGSRMFNMRGKCAGLRAKAVEVWGYLPLPRRAYRSDEASSWREPR